MSMTIVFSSSLVSYFLSLTSLGSLDGILVGLEESSKFTIEEEIGILSLGVVWDLVLSL